MSKEIPLSQGRVAIVDDEDYEWLSQWKWCILGHGKYAGRGERDGSGRQKSILMHREIMQTPQGQEVDHADGNHLNNVHANLRNCSHAENQCNQKPRVRNVTSHFKGVSKRRQKTSWLAQIRYQGQTIYLGTYALEEDAAHAYDAKAKELFGEFARVNFTE
jgi:hypothetical protein